MNHLPKEVLKHITSHLPASSTIALASTSKHLHTLLKLSTSTNPIRLLHKFARSNRDDLLHYGFELPIPLPAHIIHTLYLTLQWRDQGWGNQKGRLVIVASNSVTDTKRIVYTSRLAPHQKAWIRIPIHPREDETYHVCYIVGADGGHEINLFNISLHALIYDDERSSVKNAYRYLSALLVPFDEMMISTDEETKVLLESVRYLLLGDISLPPCIVEYFGRFGVSREELSFKFLDVVEDAMGVWRKKSNVYRTKPSRSNLMVDLSCASDFREAGNEDGSVDSMMGSVGEVVLGEYDGQKAIVSLNGTGKVLPVGESVLKYFDVNEMML